MKAYGVRRQDAGCCPGHDKYGGGRFSGHYNHRQNERRLRRAAKRRARSEGKVDLLTPVTHLSDDGYRRLCDGRYQAGRLIHTTYAAWMLDQGRWCSECQLILAGG